MQDRMSDRRSHRRTVLDCDLTLSPENMPVLPVVTMNLSASGIYCVSSRSLGELARVELVLRMEGMEEISARAVVIREEQLCDGTYGIGLFFTRISEEHRDAIIERTGEKVR